VNRLSSRGGAKRSGRKKKERPNPHPVLPSATSLSAKLAPPASACLQATAGVLPVTLIYEAKEASAEKGKHHN